MGSLLSADTKAAVLDAAAQAIAQRQREQGDAAELRQQADARCAEALRDALAAGLSLREIASAGRAATGGSGPGHVRLHQLLHGE